MARFLHNRTLFLLFFVANLLFATVCFGQAAGDYRSVASATAISWNTTTSWQRYNGTTWIAPTAAQGYPGQNTGTGAVTIQSGSIISITANVPNAIASLSVDGTLTFNDNSVLSVTISGNVSITGTLRLENSPGTRARNITIGGNFTVANTSTINMLSPDASDFGQITFNGASAQSINGTAAGVTLYNVTINKPAGVVLNTGGSVTSLTVNDFIQTQGSFSSPSTLNITGNWTKQAAAVFSATSGNIVFNGTLDQTINGTSTILTLNNVNVNKASGVLSTGGSINTITTNNFTLTQGSFTAPATLDINGGLTLTAGTLTAGNSMLVAGNWTKQAAATFNSNTGTVTFDGGSGQGISGSPTTFNNLVIANTSAAVSTNVNITASGTMTVGPLATFTPGADNIINGGTLTGSGIVQVTRIAATPSFFAQYVFASVPVSNLTVDYAGAGDQTINATTYGTLKVSGSGTKKADGHVTSGSLELNSGILEIPAGQILTLSTPSITGFSSTSYIVTQVDKSTGAKGVLQVDNIPSSGFTFPVGNGGYYLPATVTPSTNGASFNITVFQGLTENGKPNGTGFTTQRKANVVDAVWDVTGSGTASLSVAWPENLEGSSFKTLTGSMIGISHNSGGNWDLAQGSGDNTTNTATRTGITSFSPFAVGQLNSALPVHFSNVKASERTNGVQVDFANLTESDIDYYEVERSNDGQSFIAVKRLAPLRNDYSSASYSYLDASAKDGKNIYRIKAVETTGKVIYSNLVSLSLGVKEQTLNVYAVGGQVNVQVNNLAAGKFQFQIYTAAGQLINVQDINHAGGSLTQSLQLSNIKAGVYILNITGPVKLQKRFVVQ